MNFYRLFCYGRERHEFYCAVGEDWRKDCPRCHARVASRGVALKHRPKTLRKDSYDICHINSAVLSRTTRKAVEESNRRAKERREAALQAGRRRLAANMDVDEDSDAAWDVPDVEGDDDDRDGAWLPGESFKPNMRFTADDGQNFSSVQRAMDLRICKDAFTKFMTAKVNHSARRASANSVMKSSAHDHSGRGVARGRYGEFRGDHEEWNHLIADCLGGATSPANLVAASAACNSYMMSIESCINGRSDVTLAVTAYCSAEHVAEWITYTLKTRASTLTLVIDATASCFTRADSDEVRSIIRAFK